MTTTTRRLDPNRIKDGDLKRIAAMMTKLSYRDMQDFASTFEGAVTSTGSTAERLLKTCDMILGPDYDHSALIPGGTR